MKSNGKTYQYRVNKFLRNSMVGLAFFALSMLPMEIIAQVQGEKAQTEIGKDKPIKNLRKLRLADISSISRLWAGIEGKSADSLRRAEIAGEVSESLANMEYRKNAALLKRLGAEGLATENSKGQKRMYFNKRTVKNEAVRWHESTHGVGELGERYKLNEGFTEYLTLLMKNPNGADSTFYKEYVSLAIFASEFIGIDLVAQSYRAPGRNWTLNFDGEKIEEIRNEENDKVMAYEAYTERTYGGDFDDINKLANEVYNRASNVNIYLSLLPKKIRKAAVKEVKKTGKMDNVMKEVGELAEKNKYEIARLEGRWSLSVAEMRIIAPKELLDAYEEYLESKSIVVDGLDGMIGDMIKRTDSPEEVDDLEKSLNNIKEQYQKYNPGFNKELIDVIDKHLDVLNKDRTMSAREFMKVAKEMGIDKENGPLPNLNQVK